MPSANSPHEWGILGAVVATVLTVARFLWRWERTFTEVATSELERIRREQSEEREQLRAEIAALRQENAMLMARLDRSPIPRDDGDTIPGS